MTVVRHALLHDGWFWGALLAGLAVCILWALLSERVGEMAIPWSQWRHLLWLSVLYPVIEEWLFRGQLQRRLLNGRYGAVSRYGFSGANMAATVIFAVFHLVAHTPVWAALVLAPSLIYGWFRDRYDSILPGALLHIGYNTCYFSLFGLPIA